MPFCDFFVNFSNIFSILVYFKVAALVFTQTKLFCGYEQFYYLYILQIILSCIDKVM